MWLFCHIKLKTSGKIQRALSKKTRALSPAKVGFCEVSRRSLVGIREIKPGGIADASHFFADARSALASPDGARSAE
jgi:hypothetical protein